MTVRVTVWNEYEHEKTNDAVSAIYPDGIHAAIAGFLKEHYEVRTATLEEPEHGLTQEVLDNTDVLIWWGHRAHRKVEDAIVERVAEAVQNGMGLIVLHSGHHAKPFKRLLGTTCNLKWREADETETLWVVAPGHPIVEGIGEGFSVPEAEMYGEFFDIPEPDSVIFISRYSKGPEVFRSGVTFTRGLGRIFYFRPGHETYPIYYQPEVQKVITNAIKWAAPTQRHSDFSLEVRNVKLPE